MKFVKQMFDETGLEQKTTFDMDFAIADDFGGSAGVKDTFNRAFREWKENVEYLTELVLILNWRGWMWYELDDTTLSNVYFDCWEEANNYALDNLKGEDLKYFLHNVD